jgi:hypothetical protein
MLGLDSRLRRLEGLVETHQSKAAKSVINKKVLGR